jgi:lactoylglutathione lyase
MFLSKIDHIGLNVSNLDESIDFYARVFGLELLHRWDEPSQAFVGKDGTVLGLIQNPGFDFGAYTMAHVAFACDREKFADVVALVRALGLQIISGPGPQRGGETILFRDPSGNILEVCYPSVEEWLAEDREATGHHRR